MAKKMVLVDPRFLPTSRSDQSPITNALSELDEQMHEVLNSRDLTEQNKVERYNQILQKYSVFDKQKQSFSESLRSPTQSHELDPIRETQEETLQESESNKTSSFTDVTQYIPTTYQKKARLLLQRLAQHPEVSWNERGELVVKNETIRGSNVSDLVNDVMRRRKNFKPLGWEKFAEVLRESNVPQDLIGHQERWEFIRRDPARNDKTSAHEPPVSLAWETWIN